jgi:GT2 family glycosyltransferase
MMALDGVWMAARRSVAEEIGFDGATFAGFHMYDVDFTLRAHLAGKKIAVCNDLHVLHMSGGSFGPAWQAEAAKFAAKHAGRLVAGRAPRFQYATVFVHSREEAVAVMTPPWWGPAGR